MVDFTAAHAAAYTANPEFQKQYIDVSYSTDAQTMQNLWEKQYVPLNSKLYPPIQDPLEQLVSHRSAALKSQVECHQNQLYERQTLHDNTLKAIDYDSVRIDSKLLQLDDFLRGTKIGVPPEMAKRRDGLEKQLVDLERQRRDEHLAFWKDQVLLRKELTEFTAAHDRAIAGASFFES